MATDKQHGVKWGKQRYIANLDIRLLVVDPDFLLPGEMPNGPAYTYLELL